MRALRQQKEKRRKQKTTNSVGSDVQVHCGTTRSRRQNNKGSKMCTNVGKKQRQMKRSSGLGIGSLPYHGGQTNPSGPRLKLPLQSCPVSSKIHLPATRSDLIKQFKCKIHSGVTCLVQQSARVWIQRLKLNLDGETIDPNSLPLDLAVRFDRHAADQTTGTARQSRSRILCATPPASKQFSC